MYDLAARRMTKVQADAFKDQRIGLFTARQFNYPDDNEPQSVALAGRRTPNELWFWRRSRDQHKVDVLVADATTGTVRVVIEERLNTYVEHQRLELLASGDLLWWSERDGWAHLYRYRRGRDAQEPADRGAVACLGDRGDRRDPGHGLLHRQCPRARARIPTTSMATASALDGRAGDPAESRRLRPPHRRWASPTASSWTTTRASTPSPRSAAARRHHRPEAPRPRGGRLLQAAGGGLPVPGAVHRQGRRRRHRPLRRDVQAVRLRLHPAVSDRGVRLSRTADRVGGQGVLHQRHRSCARAVRDDRHHHRQPRRPSRPLEVVPQLRLRQPARLRPGRQEGRHRAARRSASRSSISTGSASTATPAAASCPPPRCSSTRTSSRSRSRRQATTRTTSTTSTGPRSTTA